MKSARYLHSLRTEAFYLFFLAGLSSLLGLYTLLRYAGYWGEGDTAIFTKAISAILVSGELLPEVQAYPNGYGYQVLVAWLVAFTQIPLGVIQVAGGALLASWIVLPAWLAYRELTRSNLAVSLATLILLVQPEFLFPLLRGTHEKFTRGLMFICLYLLMRSLRSRSARFTALLAVCFYLCAYTLISFNTFMSTSFVLGILLALLLLWVTGRWATETRQVGSPVVTRLFYVTASLLVLAFIFTFYAYEPAQQQLRILQNVWDRLALLFLQVEDTWSNPYQVVNAGWISLPVYFLVSLANWLLLGVSLVLWLKLSYTWLVLRLDHPKQHELILWALYAAFAFLGFSSILVDISGSIAANLQHRIYPTFAMLAAPLVGAWLASLKPTHGPTQKLGWAAASIGLGVLMVLSVLKATNEPLLSNTWLFYSPSEYQAVVWVEQNIPEHSLWTGPGGRIADGYIIRENGRPMTLELDPYVPQPTTYDFLVSDVTRLYAQRLGQLLPIQADSLLTYDNGATQIYHRRPLTPFQK
jgi:hypothetical protein